MSASTKSASKLYRALSSPENGTAVFLPAPNENLPDACKRTGVQVGDVGIRRGKNMSLELLFNVLLPADAAVNQNWGVPEGFVPFTVGEGRQVAKWKGYHPPGTIIARGMVSGSSLSLGGNSEDERSIPLNAGSSVELKLRSKAGAALLLPNGASREDLNPIDSYLQYVQQHAAAWYAFAEALGFLPSPNRDDALFVVTGCDKASAWVIATASRKRGSVGCNLSLSLPGAADVNFAPKYEWERDASVLVRVSENTDSDAENQCVFLRGFVVPKPRNAKSLWAMMVKKVKRRDNAHGGDRSSAAEHLFRYRSRSSRAPIMADGDEALADRRHDCASRLFLSSPSRRRASTTRANRVPGGWSSGNGSQLSSRQTERVSLSRARLWGWTVGVEGDKGFTKGMTQDTTGYVRRIG